MDGLQLSLRSGIGVSIRIERVDHAFENQPAVGASKNRFAGPFWMRHQTGNIARLVANSGNVVERPVGVALFGRLALRIHIAPQNLIIGSQSRQGFVISEIAPFSMSDGDAQQTPGRDFAGEGRLCGYGLEIDVFAAKLKGTIANERAGEQARFAKDLEPVADAQDPSALRGKALDSLHDRAESSDGAGAQIIPVTKSAWNDHSIGIAERIFLVPEQPGGVTKNVAQHMDDVLVAIRAGELDNGKVHVMKSVALCYSISNR
jgi:hypothetical protein